MTDEERDIDEELEEVGIKLADDILIDDGVELGGDSLDHEGEEGYGMSYGMPRGLEE